MIVRYEENGCVTFIDRVDQVFFTNLDGMELTFGRLPNKPVIMLHPYSNWERVKVMTDTGEVLYTRVNINYKREDGKLYVHDTGELIDDTPLEE